MVRLRGRIRSVTGHVTERMTAHWSHIGNDEKSAALAKVISHVRAPRRAPTGVEEPVEAEAQKR